VIKRGLNRKSEKSFWRGVFLSWSAIPKVIALMFSYCGLRQHCQGEKREFSVREISPAPAFLEADFKKVLSCSWLKKTGKKCF
jgi:hypothetical protein